MEDNRLVELFWSRDEQAITHAAQKYGPYCTTFAQNILDDREDSEECVNDAYLRVWNSIPEDRPIRFCAYIGRIVRNLAINRYHRNTAQKRGGAGVPVLLDELLECIPDNGTVERQSESNTIAAVLADFLGSMEEAQRVVFLRRYWYCDPLESIAERYGFSISKVKSMLLRTRGRLRARLEREGIAV